MQTKKYQPRPLDNHPTEPFDDAQEAWFWYVRCQQLRQEGGRFSDSLMRVVRPCDPDDLYRAVISLARDGRIGRAHLGVLGQFGVAERPPDPRRSDEEAAALLWDDALDGLTTVLRHKGIVRVPDVADIHGKPPSWGDALTGEGEGHDRAR